MTARELFELENELAAITDEIDQKDDYYFVREIDSLRSVVRKIAAQAELLRLREAA